MPAFIPTLNVVRFAAFAGLALLTAAVPMKPKGAAMSHSSKTTYGSLPKVTNTYSYNPDTTLSNLQVNQVGGNNYSFNFAYGYDGDARLTSLTNPYSETTTWNWLNNDWLNYRLMSNGASSNFTYYANGDLQKLQNEGPSPGYTTLSSFSTLTHDGVGNLLKEVASITGVSSYSGTVTNTYDSLDQLSSSSSTKSVNAYSHSYTGSNAPDAGGNLPSVHGTGYSYNSRNEITNTGFAFDYAGNPTSWKGNTATYDPENRMTSYGSNFTAGYRADGLRAWKRNSSATTYYYYGPGGMPVMELLSNAAVSAVYTFGADGLVSR